MKTLKIFNKTYYLNVVVVVVAAVVVVVVVVARWNTCSDSVLFFMKDHVESLVKDILPSSIGECLLSRIVFELSIFAIPSMCQKLKVEELNFLSKGNHFLRRRLNVDSPTKMMCRNPGSFT